MTEIILSSDEHSNLFDKTKTCLTETKKQNITMKQEIKLGTTTKKTKKFSVKFAYICVMIASVQIHVKNKNLI